MTLLRKAFKLLLRESTSHGWEDRLDACEALARRFGDPSAPRFSGHDAALLGKCCARQLNDKRPKVLAACAELVRVCMARAELQAAVAVPTLPALLVHSVSNKRSFKLPAKQALLAVASALALDTNCAVTDAVARVFASSRSSPKIRAVVLKMFLGACKKRGSSEALPAHFVATLETVLLRALTDKSNEVRTAGRLLFSRYVEHCPIKGAALFHGSKMKLATQKQLRRACPDAVEACVSLTYMGQNHPGSDSADPVEAPVGIADVKAATETETVVVAKTHIVKETASPAIDPTATVTTTTVTTTTTTTTTVRTPPRKGKSRELPTEGTRLASLLEWKARSENRKKYQALLSSS